MYAVAFDLEIAKLKEYYGASYTNAYYEVEKQMSAEDFEWIQGSVYIYKGNDGIGKVFDVMNRLKAIDWFRKSVRDVRAFKVEDWSDFTDRIKKE